MDPLARWDKANDAFLSAALTWLRLRLEAMALPAGADAHPTTPEDQREDATMWQRMVGWADCELASAGPASVKERIRAAAIAMREFEALEPPPALLGLSQTFGLTRFEREVLLLTVAIELDTRIAALCARAQADSNRPFPTFALALALFDEPAWDVLSPERPLRYWRLIEITQGTTQALTASVLRADERIVNLVKGLAYLDERLAPLLTPIEEIPPLPALPRSHQEVVDTVLAQLRPALDAGRLPVVQLLGGEAETKQLLALRIAGALGRHPYRLAVHLLPSQPGELETLGRLWERESQLLPLALYLDERDEDQPPERMAVLHRFLGRMRGLCFLDAREVGPEPGTASIIADVRRPTAMEQREVWGSLLGGLTGAEPGHLAGQFDLSLPTIHSIASRVRQRAARGGAADPQEELWQAALMAARPRLERLAQRIDTRATWEDLVLPAAEAAVLRQIAAQVRHRHRVYEDGGFARRMNRGLGISALFAGESGTGKTMAAEVIAADLRLDLYRIDLAGVVSKYIGETEKNLRRLFDVAESGGAILFFDEADALFGKRSEVKDSHDRYANIEINYLLQRMEAFRGLAILATNMRSALDRAFLRRLRFTVDFAFPGLTERTLIWQRAFPPETRTEGLDVASLARFDLTGGSIHSIALNAAFLAASADEPVTMGRVVDAVRAEFRKLERPVSEADFRWLEPAASVA
jgi:ATPase family associated with various cellular activities (AAA)